MTVTLHVPALRPLSVLPETLQNFAELGRTLRATFDVEATFNFASVAIDLAVIVFEIVNFRVLIIVVTMVCPTVVEGPKIEVVVEINFADSGDVVRELGAAIWTDLLIAIAG